MIELIPAIDIIDGKCVRLSQGDFPWRWRSQNHNELPKGKRIGHPNKEFNPTCFRHLPWNATYVQALRRGRCRLSRYFLIACKEIYSS